MRLNRFQTAILIGSLLILLGWLSGHNPAWPAAVSLQAVNADFPPEKLLYFLLVVGAMAMAMYELFSFIEKHTTAWAHRGSQNH